MGFPMIKTKNRSVKHCASRRRRRNKDLVFDSSLTPTVQALASALSKLEDPTKTMLRAIDHVNATSIKSKSYIKSALTRLSSSSHPVKQMALETARTTERALRLAMAPQYGASGLGTLFNCKETMNRNKSARNTGSGRSNNFVDDEKDDRRVACVSPDETPPHRRQADSALPVDHPSRELFDTSTATNTAMPEAIAAAAVSDTETPSGQEDEDDGQVGWQEVMALLIEAVQFEATTLGCARRTKFTVQRLSGRASMQGVDLAHKIRSKLQSIGMLPGGSRQDCRIYMSQHDSLTWVRIVLGPCTLQSTQTVDFLAVFKEHEEFVAVARGKAKHASLILSTLDGILVSTAAMRTHRHGTSAQHATALNLSGSDPKSLLESALSIGSHGAVGRFAAAAVSTSPLEELHTMATCNLFEKMSDSNGVQVNDMQVKSCAISNGKLNALSSGAIINHDAAKQTARKRRRDLVFGEKPPVRSCVRWIISESNAAQGRATQVTPCIKARFTIKGPNVFEGMQAFANAGLLEIDGDLPDHIRDAVHLDSVIKVVDGVVVNRPDCN
ncbi:hypothetical protein MPSEU_000283100 [Mayamaea pseudoterrestris]|nr:hypothetical protein MPSEU_000283100 [Mayamaea pseudoterrestris]